MNPSGGLNPRGDRRNSSSTTRIKGIWMSLILVILLYAVLFIRLSYIQVFKAAEYSKEAMAQRARPAQVDPVRGRILDRNGAELAYSITSNSIYVRPQDLNDNTATAAKLAPILGLDKMKLTEQLAEGQRPSIIAKKVTVEMLQTIASQRITGLSVLQQGQRFYPKGSLAGQVLGFTGTDNQGLEGIDANPDTEVLLAESADEFADLVLQVCGGAYPAMGKAARERVEQLFSLHSFRAGLTALLALPSLTEKEIAP